VKRHQNLILLFFVVLLCVVPLLLVKRPAPGPDGQEAEIFAGADGQARDYVATLAPDYQPWAESLVEPPSGEVESLLFALQAALGAGFIGYYFGTRRGKASAEAAKTAGC
jgi:cobalt/nickel transport protein